MILSGSDLKSRIALVMGELPGNAFDAPPSIALGDAVDCGDYARMPCSYRTPLGNTVHAWLLRPKAPRGTGVAALHPTIACGKDDVVGLSGRPNRNYAAELASRGHVVLAPDYPAFGESTDDPYERGFASASMMGIVNHIATVSVLIGLPGVNVSRVGAIGHSLGGHNAIFLAVFDDRVGAVACSCGLCTFSSYRGGNLAGWASRHYMPRIASDFREDPDLMPFDFPELLASLPPRAVLVNAPLRDDNFDCAGAKRCVEAARQACVARGCSPSRIVGIHPDCGHDFPPEARHEAYRFLENQLETL